MDINKSINLNAVVKLKNGGESEMIVAYFTANINDDKISHAININIINKPLIYSTEENILEYNRQYDLFLTTIRDNLV